MPAHDTAFERHAPDQRVVDRSLSTSAHSVFWLDELGSTTVHDSLTGRIEADLAVVGGGYCGLWTAVLAKLRNPGAKVVLLESRTVGWAASGRNGGFCEASLTHGAANGRSRWPDEYEALERLGTENLAAFQADCESLGIECQFERTGMLSAAVEPHQVDWLRDETEGEWLDAEGVRSEINSPVFLAGRWDRDSCALVHPARLARELARVARDLGVEIFENSPVIALDHKGADRVRVRTDRGSVSADRVALATNVFRPVLRRYRMLTVPVYDYVLMTEPLSESQQADIGWRNRQGLGDLANQFHYSRLTADNRILWGGYDAIYHAGRKVKSEYEDRPESYQKLASHFFTTFPQLDGLAFTHRWAGAIDASTQFCAFHGLARHGRIAYAGGFTGLGVGATRFAAEVMLDRLSGESTPRTQLSMVQKKPLPFPPEPLASAGIQLTRWSLDRADHREGKRNLLLRTLDSLGLGFDS